MTQIFEKLAFRSIHFLVPRNSCKTSSSRLLKTLSVWEVQKMSRDENIEKMQSQLKNIFHSAVHAVLPASIVDNSVHVVGDELRIGQHIMKIGNDVYLVGFGKAVMGMAITMEKKLGSRLKRGIVSVPRGSGDKLPADIYPNFGGPIDYRENSINNQPDDDTLITSHDIVDLVECLGENDTLVVLISGGGSALLFMPRATLAPEAKIQFCKKVQNSGASIKELNVLRKKMSMVKGGGLALMALPARVISLILSDIVGDPIDLIASGPTIYSEKSPEQVAAILKKFNLQDEIDGDLKTVLTSKETKIDEKQLLNGKKEFKHVDNFVIGNNMIAIEAANRQARRNGLSTIVLRNDVTGNVELVSESYAQLASLVCLAWDGNIDRKTFFDTIRNDPIISLTENKVYEIFDALENATNGILLIGAGEPEVIVKGPGKGGRNQELALTFSLDFLKEVNKSPRLVNFEVVFLSAGTDGQDGPTDATGAFGYPAISPIFNFALNKLRKLRNEEILAGKSGEDTKISSMLRVSETIEPREALANNDSYNFYSRFRRGRDLLKTGITGTNVMDLHFLLVKRRECGCRMEFDRGEKCPEPIDEHDLSEDSEETERRLNRSEEVAGERMRLNLKILDSSLERRCCQHKSD